jgi:hypothetical protein
MKIGPTLVLNPSLTTFNKGGRGDLPNFSLVNASHKSPSLPFSKGHVIQIVVIREVFRQKWRNVEPLESALEL